MNRSRLQQNIGKNYEGPTADLQSQRNMAPQDPSHLAGLPKGAIKPVNFHFFLWPFVVGYLLFFASLVLMLIGSMKLNKDLLLVGGFAQIPAALCLLFSFVFLLVIIYRAWASVQDGRTSVTPGKAVGLLFVPFFNLYWLFRVFPGWAKHYNSHLYQNKLDNPDKQASEGVFLTNAILAVTCFALGVLQAVLGGIATYSPSILAHYFWVPILYILASLAMIPFVLICMGQMCRGTVYLSSGR